jgi:ABC-2 type transport system ATP-binding protein
MCKILKVDRISKEFNQKNVINHLNLEIEKGEIYGLVGVNGAGKSTLMKLITNLEKPSEGEIFILGEKIEPNSYKIFEYIGASIGAPVFYEDFTAKKNLEIVCKYRNLDIESSISYVKNLVNLQGILDKKVIDLSLGMRMRLAIARALINKPKLLILDEPTNGLDPIKIKELTNLIFKIKKEGETAILISSHRLDTLEIVADRIGFLNKGSIIKEITRDEITTEKREFMEIICSDVTKTAYLIEGELNITDYRVISENTIRLYDMKKNHNEVIAMLIKAGISIESFSKKKTKLEEYFLENIEGGLIYV